METHSIVIVVAMLVGLLSSTARATAPASREIPPPPANVTPPAPAPPPATAPPRLPGWKDAVLPQDPKKAKLELLAEGRRAKGYFDTLGLPPNIAAGFQERLRRIGEDLNKPGADPIGLLGSFRTMIEDAQRQSTDWNAFLVGRPHWQAHVQAEAVKEANMLRRPPNRVTRPPVRTPRGPAPRGRTTNRNVSRTNRQRATPPADPQLTQARHELRATLARHQQGFHRRDADRIHKLLGELSPADREFFISKLNDPSANIEEILANLKTVKNASDFQSLISMLRMPASPER